MRVFVCFHFLQVLLDSLQLEEHPLHFTIVIFPERLQVRPKLVYFLVLDLLALDEDVGVIEALLHQMHLVVFSQHFYFAPQFIVWAAHELEFALVFVDLHLLPDCFCAALVVALNDLEQTSVIVLWSVLNHQHSHTLLVLANDTTVAALVLVLVKVFALHGQRAAVVKQGLALIWALDDLELACCLTVLIHISPVNLQAAFVFAGDL